MVDIPASDVIKTTPFATRQRDGRHLTSHYRKSESPSIQPGLQLILTTPREMRVILKEHGQLTEGLQYMYLRSRSGQGWEGSPVKSDSKGRPLVHEILERIGVVDQQMDSANGMTKEEQGSVSNESMDQDPPTPFPSPPSQAAMPASYPAPEPWKPEFSYEDTNYGFWMPCDSTLAWDNQASNHIYLTPPMEQGYGFSSL